MTNYKICVYAICKNEENNIKDWIESVKEADIISITDTGSDDSTIKKIEEFEFSDENQYPDGKHVKLIHHTYENTNTKYFNFGKARQKALSNARSDAYEWDKYDDNDNDWLMVCFDLDERPQPDFFTNLREICNNNLIPTDQNYIISCKGITYISTGEGKKESTQIVENKIHTDVFDEEIFQWERQVHERLILHNANDKTYRKPQVLTFNEYNLSYVHNQDKDKKRDYYEALQESYENGDKSALNCIYLAWEAGLHQEIDACIKYSYECIKASLNPKDMDYGNWENISQAFYNIIINIKADSLENAQRLSSVLKSCDKIINDKVPNYVPNRKMYMTLGTSYEALFAFLCKKLADTENPVEEDQIEEIAVLSESYCRAAIYYYKKTLQVEETPLCWFEDRSLYEKDNDIISKFPLFYEALGDKQRAVAYSVVLENNTLDENLKKGFTDFKNIYLDNFNEWVKDVEPLDTLIDNLKAKYPELNEPIQENIGVKGSQSEYQPMQMEETTPASITGDRSNIFDLNGNMILNDDNIIPVDPNRDINIIGSPEELEDIINDREPKVAQTLEDILDMHPEVTNNDNVVEYPKKSSDNRNLVCVYAICKNELKFVDKWVESMKEADLIVVLDTGSDDGTYGRFMEIAEDLKSIPDGCQLIVEQQVVNPWRFDTARNLALDLVPPEYNILISTDLDEILEPGWAQILRDKWVEGVHERGVYKYSWSHLANGESGRVFHYDKIHSRNWRWKCPCHELLYHNETNSNLYSQDNTLYLFNDIHLHHYPDWSKPRGNYMKLLELRAKENPDDYYGLIYLAHEYSYKYLYEKSNKVFNYILSKFKDRCNSIEEASCYLFMGDNYLALEKYSDALESYNKAIEIEGTYREPYLNKAKVYMEIKEYESAIDCINEGIANGERHYSWLERDHSWSYEPYDLLSLCHYYKKNPNIVASYIFASRAAQYDTSNERLQNNVKLILQHLDDKTLISALNAE